MCQNKLFSKNVAIITFSDSLIAICSILDPQQIKVHHRFGNIRVLRQRIMFWIPIIWTSSSCSKLFGTFENEDVLIKGNCIYLKELAWSSTAHTQIFYNNVQGDQDHFFPKEMLISPSILKLHKNPWIWEGLTTIHFI